MTHLLGNQLYQLCDMFLFIYLIYNRGSKVTLLVVTSCRLTVVTIVNYLLTFKVTNCLILCSIK